MDVFVDTGYIPVIGTTCVYYVKQGLSVWCRLVVCSTGAAETRGAARRAAANESRATFYSWRRKQNADLLFLDSSQLRRTAVSVWCTHARLVSTGDKFDEMHLQTGDTPINWRRCRFVQEAQLSPKYRAMRRVSWNLANCHATVQKLLVRQVLNRSKLCSWRVTVGQCVINMYTQPWHDRVASIIL